MPVQTPLPSGPTGAGPEAVEAPIEVVYTTPEAPWWIGYYPTEEVSEAWWVEIEVEEELPWTVEEI